MAKSELRLFSNIRFVFVTPFPTAGLKRLHHRMSGLFEVLVGMLAGRGIAAAYVSAN